MEIPDEVLTAANRRGAATRAAFPAVAQVRYDRRIGRIVVALSGGGWKSRFRPSMRKALKTRVLRISK